MNHWGHCLCHVVHVQHTRTSLCVCTSTHGGLWGAEFTHACTQVCVHRSTVASVRACAGWGLVHPWHCLLALPICRECPGPGGAGWRRNLSQLLCPVSGKPPAGVLPTEPACPCTRKAPGGPAPSRCMPESTAQTHTMQGMCNPLPPHLQSPSQSEPEENPAERTLQVQSRHMHVTLGEGRVLMWVSALSGGLQAQGLCTENI